MLEQQANILSPEIMKQADAICFTSNGIVKDNGQLVMGAGVAKQFAQRFPAVPDYMGKCVAFSGNHCYMYPSFPRVVSFPTKEHWRNPSTVELIIQSAKELVALADRWKWKRVFLTRPGCGLGSLNWESQVKPAISSILDDRFIVLAN